MYACMYVCMDHSSKSRQLTSGNAGTTFKHLPLLRQVWRDFTVGGASVAIKVADFDEMPWVDWWQNCEHMAEKHVDFSMIYHLNIKLVGGFNPPDNHGLLGSILAFLSMKR